MAAAPLCLLLVAVWLLNLGAHPALPGGGCDMACCKRVGADMGRHAGHSRMAMPAPPTARCEWRCAPGQHPAAPPEMPPLALAAPVRLPAPSTAAIDWQRPPLSATPPYLELSERPPRA